MCVSVCVCTLACVCDVPVFVGLCERVKNLSPGERMDVFREFSVNAKVSVRSQRRWWAAHCKQAAKGHACEFNGVGRPRSFTAEDCARGVAKCKEEVETKGRASLGDVPVVEHLTAAKKERPRSVGRPASFRLPTPRTVSRTISHLAAPGPGQLLTSCTPQKTDQLRLDSSHSVRNMICFAATLLATTKLLTRSGPLFNANVKGCGTSEFRCVRSEVLGQQ